MAWALSAPGAAAPAAAGNPFVGPRPYSFEESARFCGRTREVEDLAALVIANRCVLLHSRSGAGKTSLINAGLLPRLAAGGLGRVQVSRPVLASLEALGAAGADSGDGPLQVLVIDQFEELFTSRDKPGTTPDAFVRFLSELLDGQPTLRLLLSMREEWLADIDEFAGLFPGGLRTRYRLEKLDSVAATEAIEEPFRLAGRRFADGVLEALVADLADESGVVEPVQLQVVCFELFRVMPPDATVIDDAMRRRFAVVGEALKAFYEGSLEDARKATGIRIAALRRWFDEELITADRTRGLSRRGDHHTGGVSNRAVDFLESRHIIRPEARGADVWYELSHDRLIEPIRDANSAWRFRRLILQYSWAIGVAGLVIAALIGTVQYYRRLNVVEERTRRAAVAARNQALAKTLMLNVLDRVRGARDDNLSLLLLKAAAGFNREEPLLGLGLVRTLEQPYLVRVLPSSLASATAVAWSPDGRRLAAAGTGGGAHVWELPGGKVVQQPPGALADAGALAWSPDGTRLAIGDTSGKIMVWDVVSGQTSLVPVDRAGVTALAWHPGEPTLAAGTLTGSVFAVTMPEGAARPLAKLRARVSSMAFSTDGQLAVASWDRMVRTWKTLDRPPVASPRMLSPVAAVAWSRAGRLASAGWDNTVREWDPGTMREVDRREGTQRFHALAWSHDGRSLLAAGADQQIHIWPWAAGAPERALSGTGGVVNGLAADPTADRFAHISADGVVRIWAPNTSGAVVELRGLESAVTAARMVTSGEVISGAADGTIRIWYSEEGHTQQLTLVGPLAPVTHIDAAFEEGSTRVFAAGNSVDDPSRGTVCVWGLGPRLTWAAGARRSRDECYPRPGRSAPRVTSLAYRASDGVLLFGDEAGNVSFLTVTFDERRKIYRLAPAAQPIKTSASPITQLLVQGGGEVLAGDADGRLWRVHDAATPAGGEALGCTRRAVYAWNRDGSRRAAACGRDVFLTPAAGTEPAPAFSVRSDVTRLSWSPDGSLAYGLADGSVGLPCAGAPESELCVAIPAHAGAVTELTWSADGKRLLTGGADNVLRSWLPPHPFRLDPCSMAIGALSRDEWRQFVGADIPYAAPCSRP
jgi:WD40 repeat protein